MSDSNRPMRILSMYTHLQAGGLLKKREFAKKFNTSTKTVQRDINELRLFLETENIALVYDDTLHGYKLASSNSFTTTEALALAKIVISCHPFTREELNGLVQKLLRLFPESNRTLINKQIGNELKNYKPPQHNQLLLERLNLLQESIAGQKIVTITYRGYSKVKTYKINPVSLIFSMTYFYLLAFMTDKELNEPTIFRVDRVISIEKSASFFPVDYKDRFKPGEFKKYAIFMHGGDLVKKTFLYSGNLEVLLDTLPTAKIVGQEQNKLIIEVTAFRRGLELWLEKEQNNVELLDE